MRIYSITNSLYFLLWVYLIVSKKTPLCWHSKKQIFVDTSAYFYDVLSFHTCVNNIIGFCNTLRCIGVNIRQKRYFFVNNKCVVKNNTHLHSKLHRCHTLLSFHRAREDIASNMVAFCHVSVGVNPDNILSMHWSYSNI